MVTRVLISGDLDRDNVKEEEEVAVEKKVAVAQKLKKRKTLDLYPVQDTQQTLDQSQMAPVTDNRKKRLKKSERE